MRHTEDGDEGRTDVTKGNGTNGRKLEQRVMEQRGDSWNKGQTVGTKRRQM